ncbi:hypothetical protein PN36_00470 [Candidatus Thiomargarita nelsonii]|uniref:KilA-N DNA-binding domain-containing protein n=1 Tax=Candidatus Thiomargarita nelsonii TaxID=1003181 RepID=A0A4E0RUH7_9GAMM|nr:hypothetical protein PN36_00470 [Candidatus Thiomargarita nelsonii]
MSNNTQVAPKTQQSGQVVAISGNDITRIVYKEQPVLTFRMIDELHQRPERTAQSRFSENKSRFIENEDYYVVEYSKKHVLRVFGIDVPPRGLIVLTQTGYAMLAKIFTDDLAWQIQRELVNKYFAPPLQSQMLEYARINKELMALFGIDGNMQTLALNNAMQKEFGVNLLETWDLNGLKSEQQQQTLTVSDIAKQLGIGTRKINPVLIEAGLQTSHRDHKDRLYYELTDKGLEYAIYLDTGKKHSDGTPIRQIKWYDSVVEVLKRYLQLPRGCF